MLSLLRLGEQIADQAPRLVLRLGTDQRAIKPRFPVRDHLTLAVSDLAIFHLLMALLKKAEIIRGPLHASRCVPTSFTPDSRCVFLS